MEIDWWRDGRGGLDLVEKTILVPLGYIYIYIYPNTKLDFRSEG